MTARYPLAAFVLLASLAVAPIAHAQTWSESGDAGDQLATAQVPTGTGSLTQITGSLPLSDDVDVYCIHLNTVPPANAPIVALQCVLNQGPNIWLFDANGYGVFTNETCSLGNKVLLAPNTGLAAGNYYVAVSYYGRNANSAGGDIWQPGLPGQRTPDGPGAASPLSAWLGIVQQNPLNPYTINLQYMGYCTGPVPVHAPTWGALKSFYR